MTYDETVKPVLTALNKINYALTNDWEQIENGLEIQNKIKRAIILKLVYDIDGEKKAKNEFNSLGIRR
jgi:hypothetical protein